MWNDNNGRVRVLGRRWNWIKTQNRVVLSFLAFALKFTWWTFHIPDSSFHSHLPLVAKGMMFLLSFDGHRNLSTTKDELRSLRSNPVVSYSLRIFGLDQMTTVAIRIPLMEFSSRIGFSSTYVLDHGTPRTTTSKVRPRVAIQQRETVRQYPLLEKERYFTSLLIRHDLL